MLYLLCGTSLVVAGGSAEGASLVVEGIME